VSSKSTRVIFSIYKFICIIRENKKNFQVKIYKNSLNSLKVFSNMSAVQTYFPVFSKPLEDYREDVFLQLFVDPYDKIYKGEVDEKRILNFFKEYCALSRRSDLVPTSQETTVNTQVLLKKDVFPKKQKQAKAEVQKAILLFRKLFYSSKLYKLHLSSVQHHATVDEILAIARPFLAGYDTLTADATGESSRVTQESMPPTQDDQEDQKQELTCWYQSLTSCYHQEKPKDQMLVGSLMSLLAAIVILTEEAEEISVFSKVKVSKEEVGGSEDTFLSVNTLTAAEYAFLFALEDVPQPEVVAAIANLSDETDYGEVDGSEDGALTVSRLANMFASEDFPQPAKQGVAAIANSSDETDESSHP
jgi:hypothetical protein